MTEDVQQQSLRQYLLGAPLEADQRQLIEEHLLTDNEVCEQVEIVEDELIEQYLAGELSEEERAQFEEGFLSTAERREKLRVARALNIYVMKRTAPASLEVETVAPKVTRVPFWSRRPAIAYVGIAAGILVILFGALLWRAYFSKSDVERGLVALNEAYRQQRPAEARITGLDYAPAAQTRGSSEKFDSVARDRAERFLQDAAHERKTPAALHALGRLYLAERQYDKAIEQFEAALAGAPDDARLHSDLGAALMERGSNASPKVQGGTVLTDFAQSLEHFNRALTLNPSLLDAVFNRALLYQHMDLPRQAAAEWRHYLELDANSQWAEEARRKLKLLEDSQKLSSATSKTLEDFLDGYRAHEDERAWQALSGSREMITGRMVPFQLARNALHAEAEGKRSEVNALLDALKYAGTLERDRSNDPFFAELANYYAAGRSDERRRQLNEAQTELSEGYRLCQASQYDEARVHFARAQSVFTLAGDVQEARLTNYWIAYCDGQGDRLEESVTQLEDLAVFCRRRNYRWLLSQALYSLANSQDLLGDHSRSLALGAQALEIAVSIYDAYNQQKVLTQMALQYTELGRPETALEYHQRTLEIAALGARIPRQDWRTYTYIAQTFYTLRKYDAAVAYEREALRLSIDALADPTFTHFSHTQLGMILAAMKDYDGAIKEVGAGLDIARALQNDSATRKIAYSLLELGHVTRQSGDCDAALRNYDEAVKLFDAMQIGKLDGYDVHKGRLLCYLKGSNDAVTEAELTHVLALFEQDRAEIAEEQNRNSFFDAEQDVYDIAINYAYARGDKQRAYEYSEQSRARSLLDLLTHGAGTANTDLDVTIKANASPLDLSDLKAQLPAGVQVVQYSVLNDRLLIWFISPARFEVFERSIPASQLNASVRAYTELLTRNDESQAAELNRQAAALYELLLAPVASLLDNNAEVCIVPDKALFRLPFAALVAPGSGHYLVQDYTLLFAPSASVLIHCSQTAQQRRQLTHAERVLSVGNPAFDRTAYPQLPDLPAAAVEAKRVAQLYGNDGALTEARAQKGAFTERVSHAQVIHFAGHYLVDERTPLRSRLLFANGDALTAAEVLREQLPQARLVVLSACDTEVEGYINSEGMIGMARTFLAAGAPLVVASQWSVDSGATAELMIRFHELRKAEGVSTSLALRRAQQEMLAGPDKRYHNPYYWAAFVPVGGHADY